MKDDLISRSALLKMMETRLDSLRKEYGPYDHYTDGYDEAVDKVYNAPAVDAVEVVHGRWERILNGNYECSRCGCRPYYSGSIYTLNYCPTAEQRWTEKGKTMTELKPCPFCGGGDIRVITTVEQCLVCCTNCHANISRMTFKVCGSLAEAKKDAEPKAKRAWNRRADND